MNLSHTDSQRFNGSRDMVSISAFVDDQTAGSPSEVIVTAQTTNDPAWSTTITIPPFKSTNPAGRIAGPQQ